MKCQKRFTTIMFRGQFQTALHSSWKAEESDSADSFDNSCKYLSKKSIKDYSKHRSAKVMLSYSFFETQEGESRNHVQMEDGWYLLLHLGIGNAAIWPGWCGDPGSHGVTSRISLRIPKYYDRSYQATGQQFIWADVS